MTLRTSTRGARLYVDLGGALRPRLWGWVGAVGPELQVAMYELHPRCELLDDLLGVGLVRGSGSGSGSVGLGLRLRLGLGLRMGLGMGLRLGLGLG